MTSTTCGHCGAVAQMHPASGVFITPDGFGVGFFETAFACENCNRVSVATDRRDFDGVPTRYRYDSNIQTDWTSATWIPRPGEKRAFPDVPSHIAEAATEATLCLSVGACRAVGSLARAVIEATAKDKGITSRDLSSKIDALEQAKHIRPNVKEVAHEIRYFGNDMAHGDFADPVTKAEAEEIIDLMSEVLNEVYQAPANLARRKAARLGRASGT